MQNSQYKVGDIIPISDEDGGYVCKEWGRLVRPVRVVIEIGGDGEALLAYRSQCVETGKVFTASELAAMAGVNDQDNDSILAYVESGNLIYDFNI